MTDKECVDKYFEFLHAINQQGYSQHLMEIASNMFVLVPKESKEYAMNKFTEIAKLGLPETDYHYETSQVFKELMGYE